MSYQDVKERLYHGHRKIANNTYLELWEKPSYDEEWIEMRLHGNLVAKFYPDHMELYSAGWHTGTTKRGLNLALELAGISGRIKQEDWTWFLDIYYPSNSQLFQDGMKLDYQGNIIS